ncbi:hypothetical protein PtA15_3A379 [Puccinia triticina]|uniref:Uncharacterized protein n=1 Tax=Puccinia triticina TaxID=208348 RepID=A0ABY7CDL3_9BASI|nr:uncharacterized protein PtA15_3A379 [Puccinia triticina]WAQ83013.1 hypothetical protein PtA15_3A379 [Puccinia triticina]
MQFSVPIAVCLAFAHTSIARPFNPTLPSSSLGSPLGLPTPDYIINNPNLPIRPQPVPANNGPTPNDPLRFLNPNNLYGPPINNPSGIALLASSLILLATEPTTRSVDPASSSRRRPSPRTTQNPRLSWNDFLSRLWIVPSDALSTVAGLILLLYQLRHLPFLHPTGL